MNDPSKLFRVLVLGGAILGTACGGSAPPEVTTDGAAPDAGARDDAAATADDGGAEDGGAVGGELCFCPGPEGTCCETDLGGVSVPRAGIMCCWGTSC